jgi:FkbM family methyltransferase
MRQRLSDSLIGLYEHTVRSGALDRPRARRGFEALYLLYKRTLEAGPIGGLQSLVGPGTTVIDVGANIGFFTVPFARWTGVNGRVIAIEPEARNVASLERRIAHAGLGTVVELVCAAAAERTGELRLAVTPAHPGDHHLAESGVPIVAVTLDQLVAGDTRTTSLVKIDVQGAEALVLAGARDLIARDRPAILVEIDAPALARMGSSPRALIETIMTLGYEARQLTRTGPGALQEPESLVARSAAGYIDVLFVAEQRVSGAGTPAPS